MRFPLLEFSSLLTLSSLSSFSICNPPLSSLLSTSWWMLSSLEGKKVLDRRWVSYRWQICEVECFAFQRSDESSCFPWLGVKLSLSFVEYQLLTFRKIQLVTLIEGSCMQWQLDDNRRMGREIDTSEDVKLWWENFLPTSCDQAL